LGCGYPCDKIETRATCRNLVDKPRGKQPLGRPRGWEAGIKMYLREIGYEECWWITLV
jgi:hypothetical protein